MICNAIIDQSLSEHFQNAAISCVTQKSPNFVTVTFLLTESWYYYKISPVLHYVDRIKKNCHIRNGFSRLICNFLKKKIEVKVQPVLGHTYFNMKYNSPPIYRIK